MHKHENVSHKVFVIHIFIYDRKHNHKINAYVKIFNGHYATYILTQIYLLKLCNIAYLLEFMTN